VAAYFERAVDAAVRFGTESVQAAAKAADAQRFLRAQTELTGGSFEENAALGERLRREFGVSRQAAQGLVAQGLSFTTGAGQADATEAFLLALGDAAAASGRSISELNELITQLQAGSDEATEKLLAGKQPQQIYDDFAESLDVTADKLDGTAKRAAILAEVLDRGALTAGTARDRLEDVAGQLDQLESLWTDMQTAVGQTIADTNAFNVSVDVLRTLLDETSEEGRALRDVLESIGPILEGTAIVFLATAGPTLVLLSSISTEVDRVTFAVGTLYTLITTQSIQAAEDYRAAADIQLEADRQRTKALSELIVKQGEALLNGPGLRNAARGSATGGEGGLTGDDVRAAAAERALADSSAKALEKITSTREKALDALGDTARSAELETESIRRSVAALGDPFAELGAKIADIEAGAAERVRRERERLEAAIAEIRKADPDADISDLEGAATRTEDAILGEAQAKIAQTVAEDVEKRAAELQKKVTSAVADTAEEIRKLEVEFAGADNPYVRVFDEAARSAEAVRTKIEEIARVAPDVAERLGQSFEQAQRAVLEQQLERVDDDVARRLRELDDLRNEITGRGRGPNDTDTDRLVNDALGFGSFGIDIEEAQKRLLEAVRSGRIEVGGLTGGQQEAVLQIIDDMERRLLVQRDEAARTIQNQIDALGANTTATEALTKKVDELVKKDLAGRVDVRLADGLTADEAVPAGGRTR
jgi:hypothetical protein